MIGAFYNDANQNNPEALERNRGENGELSQEQQEMADKWATAMTPETEAEPSTAANSATPTEALSEQPTTETQPSSTIQHFSEGELEDSNFNPLPPEEQLAADAKAAAVANANELAEGEGDRNDNNNLVAEAVAEASQDGQSIKLNEVGAKLEQNGVSIKEGAADYEPDISDDLKEANSNNGNDEPNLDNVSNLAIDSGVEALALKEQAADIKSAAKSSDPTLETQIADFEKAKSDARNLVQTAESAANNAGVEPDDTIDEANNMIDEAQEIVNEAQATAEAQADAASATVTGADIIGIEGQTPDEEQEKGTTSRPATSPDTISTDIFEDLSSVGAPKQEAPTETTPQSTDKSEQPLSDKYTAANYPELAGLEDPADERKRVFTN